MHPSTQLEVARQRQAEIAESVRYVHHSSELHAAEETSRTRRRRLAVLAVAGLLALVAAPHAFAAPVTSPAFPSDAVAGQHHSTAKGRTGRCQQIGTAVKPSSVFPAIVTLSSGCARPVRVHFPSCGTAVQPSKVFPPIVTIHGGCRGPLPVRGTTVQPSKVFPAITTRS